MGLRTADLVPLETARSATGAGRNRVNPAHEEEFFPRTPDNLIASDVAGEGLARQRDSHDRLPFSTRPGPSRCSRWHGITRNSEGALRDDQQLKLVAQLMEAEPNSLTGRDRVVAVITADRVRKTNAPPTTEPRNDLKLSASHVAWASTIVPE